MNFISSKSKPVPSEISYCNFRSSKAYLWSVIFDRLKSLQINSSYSLNILDAACHSLISRNIFPSSSCYYGLDISSERLLAALPIKRSSDVLFLGDLLLPLPFKSSFDVVVSCNTMSHLLPEERCIAINHLLETLKPNSTFIVNLPVDEHMISFFTLFNKRFTSFDIVYFDSFLSHQAESDGLINRNNITQCVNDYELALPNDAFLHRQVLVQCEGFQNVGPPIPLKTFSTSKINVINKSRPIIKSIFESDDMFIEHLLSQDGPVTVLFTPLFFSSASSNYLISLLKVNKIHFTTLSIILEVNSLPINVYTVGLETCFVYESGSDRLALNRIRRSYLHSMHYILFTVRDGKRLYPSVIFDD